MKHAERDRDDHGFSLGPSSNKGTVAMQKNSDELDCIEMTVMIVGRAKSTWQPVKADDIREMYMIEKGRKGRTGRGNSDRLLEELLVPDIASRMAPFYHPEVTKALTMDLDGQFADVDVVKNAIWPAYGLARQREGFKEESDDPTMHEKSMLDFYI